MYGGTDVDGHQTVYGRSVGGRRTAVYGRSVGGLSVYGGTAVYGGSVGVRRDCSVRQPAYPRDVYSRCTAGLYGSVQQVYSRCTAALYRDGVRQVGVRRRCTSTVYGRCTEVYGSSRTPRCSLRLVIPLVFVVRSPVGSVWRHAAHPWPRGHGYHCMPCQPEAPPPRTQTVPVGRFRLAPAPHDTLRYLRSEAVPRRTRYLTVPLGLRLYTAVHGTLRYLTVPLGLGLQPAVHGTLRYLIYRLVHTAVHGPLRYLIYVIL